MSQAQEVEVTVGGRTVKVRPLTFNQRLKVYEMLGEAAAVLGGQQKEVLERADPLAVIPVLIRMVAPRLKEIFAMVAFATDQATQEQADEIGQVLTMSEEAALIEAIVEINDIPLFISRMRGAVERFGKKLKPASV